MSKGSKKVIFHCRALTQGVKECKKIIGGDRANQYTKKQLGQNDQPAKTTTRAVVAKAHGISEGAVKHAVEFSHGLDSADEVAPGFKASILTGTVKAHKTVIASLPKMEGTGAQITRSISSSQMRQMFYSWV